MKRLALIATLAAPGAATAQGSFGDQIEIAMTIHCHLSSQYITTASDFIQAGFGQIVVMAFLEPLAHQSSTTSSELYRMIREGVDAGIPADEMSMAFYNACAPT